jgi:GST-like protein
MSKGIDVPFSLGNLLDDEEEQKKFTDNAQNILQK